MDAAIAGMQCGAACLQTHAHVPIACTHTHRFLMGPIIKIKRTILDVEDQFRSDPPPHTARTPLAGRLSKQARVAGTRVCAVAQSLEHRGVRGWGVLVLRCPHPHSHPHTHTHAPRGAQHPPPTHLHTHPPTQHTHTVTRTHGRTVARSHPHPHPQHPHPTFTTTRT